MQEALFEDRIYYRLQREASSRFTLLFVHGLSGSSSAWLPYEDFFKKEYTVLSVDLRGHGASYKPRDYDEYAVTKNAEDVGRLIEHLQLKNIIVVSHSFGTLIALELLRKSTSIVASIFISATYLIHTGIRGYIEVPLTLFASALLSMLPSLHSTGKHIDYTRYRNTGDWNMRRMAADIPNTGLHAYVYSLAQANFYSTQSDWRAIKVPTLIIHGENDTLVPVARAQRLAHELGATIEVVSNANHILVLNNVRDVTALIQEFLKKLKEHGK